MMMRHVQDPFRGYRIRNSMGRFTRAGAVVAADWLTRRGARRPRRSQSCSAGSSTSCARPTAPRKWCKRSWRRWG